MPEWRSRRFLVYASVGGVGTAVQYAFLIAMVQPGILGPTVASVTGAVLGAIVNYVLNARITFSSDRHAHAIPRFAATALLGAICTGIIMSVATGSLHVPYLAAQVVATAVSLLVTYAVNSAWTFRLR